MGEVTAINTGGETPEGVRDWLNEVLDSGHVTNVVIVVESNDPKVGDASDVEWYGNGTRGQLWWLVSWCFRSMQRRWFG